MNPRNLPQPGRYRARLRHVRALTETTKHLEWVVTAGGPFEFLPGQFISMSLARDGQEHTRAYSVASPPRGDSQFDLCLNRVPGGLFSNYLCDLEPGNEIEFTGPHGFFLLEQPPVRPQVFIATGTGIAPIRSMLWHLLAEPRPDLPECWLLFGVRYPHTILYREEFEHLAATVPRFHFVPVLSRAPEDWPGERGHVQDALRRLFSGRADFDAYICGLRAMVDDVRQILKTEFGLDRRRIHYERYD